MPATKNRHGLSRYIPESVKREVRQRCGFGCAVCGSPVGYEYHHFDPPYEDALEHRADGIVLLCPSCHGAEGAWISLSDIAKASERPKAKSLMFAETKIFGGFGVPRWAVGSNVSTNSPLLAVGNLVLGRIEPPEEGATQYRLSLRLVDPEGGELFVMIRNHLRIGANRFDVTYHNSPADGGVIVVRSKKGKIILDLRIRASEFVEIHRLEAMNGQTILLVDDGRMIVQPAPRTIIFTGNKPQDDIHPVFSGGSGGFGPQPGRSGDVGLDMRGSRNVSLIGGQFKGFDTAVLLDKDSSVTLENNTMEGGGNFVHMEDGG